jgi:hypothetical protein
MIIADDEWPLSAQVSCAEDGEWYCDEYALHVRQHADGRSLVYGILISAESQDWEGGELLAAGADLPAGIQRVGMAGEFPVSVIHDCIEDLDDLATLRERICPECGAPESEIAERGHREVGRRACCHACTCIPEHFDLEEHETECQ